jgi:hypothetical protein
MHRSYRYSIRRLVKKFAIYASFFVRYRYLGFSRLKSFTICLNFHFFYTHNGPVHLECHINPGRGSYMLKNFCAFF